MVHHVDPRTVRCLWKADLAAGYYREEDEALARAEEGLGLYRRNQVTTPALCTPPQTKAPRLRQWQVELGQLPEILKTFQKLSNTFNSAAEQLSGARCRPPWGP